MYTINLASFNDSEEFIFEMRKEELPKIDGFEIEPPVRVRMTLTKEKDSEVLAMGALEAAAGAQCSRCLEPVKIGVKAEFTAVFKDREKITGDDLENDIYEYANNVINPAEFIGQALLLELPSKPVCFEACAGLCPVCGKNRNNEKCGCKSEAAKGFSPFSSITIEDGKIKKTEE
ncbi:MAG TPA: DUF177 domain-containing protein [bacterium]|nr:DUF177 domain-containing protein [bacterium]